MPEKVWDFVVLHRYEILWALLFGVIIAIIFELLDFGSRLRGLIRKAKNKLAERSAARLRERIKQLQAEKKRYAEYLASDKVHYMTTLVIMIALLMSMCLAGIIGTMGRILHDPSVELLVVMFYLFGVVLGAHGIKDAVLSSRTKLEKAIAEVNSEVIDLEEKLKGITK